MSLMPRWVGRRDYYYLKPADVIVERVGDRARAIDKNGNLIAESTDHAEVIQNVIDHVANNGGGKIYIEAGTYILSNPIRLKDNIIIEGVGNATILKLTYNANCNVIENYDTTNGNLYIKILNIKIDANNSNQDPNSVVRGISLQKCGYVEISGVIITNTTRHGIYCSSCHDLFIHNNYLYNIGINNISGGDGISLSNCYRTSISHNIIESTNDAGIFVSGLWSTTSIIGNIILNTYTGNIWVSSGGYVSIKGNILWKNVANGYGGVHLSWDGTNNNEYIIVTGNIIYQTDYGLRITHCNNCVFEENAIISPSTSPVYITNITNTTIRRNIGYTTESHGVTTLSGDGTTTDFLLGTHGLSPSITDLGTVVVKCTPASSDAISASPVVCYLSDEDGDGVYESIRAKFASAPASGTDNVVVSWEAEYIG